MPVLAFFAGPGRSAEQAARLTGVMTTIDYAEPAVSLADARMPLLGLGTWQIRNSDAPAATAAALAAGYRHIDTATGYANEAGIGKGLRTANLPRESVFLTTKMPPDNVGRERQTLEQSLTKLGVDYVDLWLVHWPPHRQACPEAWEEFVRARSDGLARSIGVSNYSLSQIDELTQATGVTPEVNQIRWGTSIYDPAVVSGLEQRGVVLEGYSPFKASNLDDPTLVRIGTSHDASAAQIIVAWHVAHGFVVIPKSVHQDRIVANAAGARIELTADEVAAIDGLSGR
ncbi:MAG TPA: aldo/keto reductase [Propionibacteriaceae bacterium]|nr:aldo/keto reductase [Propionibacteriaceae bacterium]